MHFQNTACIPKNVFDFLVSKEKYLEGVNLLGEKLFGRRYFKIREFVNILDKVFYFFSIMTYSYVA